MNYKNEVNSEVQAIDKEILQLQKRIEDLRNRRKYLRGPEIREALPNIPENLVKSLENKGIKDVKSLNAYINGTFESEDEFFNRHYSHKCTKIDRLTYLNGIGKKSAGIILEELESYIKRKP